MRARECAPPCSSRRVGLFAHDELAVGLLRKTIYTYLTVGSYRDEVMEAVYCNRECPASGAGDLVATRRHDEPLPQSVAARCLVIFYI